MVKIYVDGGNSTKNKVGGCAAIVTKDNVIIAEVVETYTGAQVTNNTMELGGAILACQYMLDHPELGKDVTIVADSRYVVDGSSLWLPRWKLNGWKSKTGSVKNKELWEAIDYLKTQLNITWQWTAGHDTCALNNRADELLVAAYRKLIKKK